MIKKFIIFSLLFALVGCQSVIPDNAKTENEYADFQHASNVKIVTDTSTGCQYAIIDPYANNSVMSPYFDSKGKISGCGNTNEN